MKFINLVDPNDSFDPDSSYEQGNTPARRIFPKLVEAAGMTYWRPGQEIPATGIRVLMGLAPTFSLLDMRLVDLLAVKIKDRRNPLPILQVFDIDDLAEKHNFRDYFPDMYTLPSGPPFVGIWNSGQHIETSVGGLAVDKVLALFGVRLTAAELQKSLTPPTRDLFELETPNL